MICFLVIAGVALFASSSRAGPAESGLTKARLGFSEASESLSPDSDSESGSSSESDAGSPCRVCIRGACLPTAGGCGIMRTRWSLRSSKLRSGQNCQCGWVGELVGAVRARARVSASASACVRACVTVRPGWRGSCQAASSFKLGFCHQVFAIKSFLAAHVSIGSVGETKTLIGWLLCDLSSLLRPLAQGRRVRTWNRAVPPTVTRVSPGSLGSHHSDSPSQLRPVPQGGQRTFAYVLCPPSLPRPGRSAEDSSFTPCGVYLWLESREE